MLAYDHDWEELTAKGLHGSNPTPAALVLKETFVSHYHNKKVYTLR